MNRASPFACLVFLTILSCSAGPAEPPGVAEPAAPKSPDCESSGGLCLPNTTSAPATYRQATVEEGVCKRRDEICWMRQ